MKRLVVSLIVTVILITFTLCSCSPVYQYSISPESQPMSKWEADGFELYITDLYKGLLICYFTEKTIAYDVYFSAGNSIQLMDRRPQDVVFEDNVLYSDAYEKPGYTVAIGSYHPSSKTKCTMTIEGSPVKTSCFSKEQELVFRRTATDLTAYQIPTIEIDANFTNCPIYSIGSKWISHDGNITIDIEGQLRPYKSYAIGKIAINGQTDENIYIAFNEIDSVAYLGNLTTPKSFPLRYDTQLASDQWKCEFFEDYFVATVICSNYYEPGDILTFTLVRTPTNSTE